VSQQEIEHFFPLAMDSGTAMDERAGTACGATGARGDGVQPPPPDAAERRGAERARQGRLLRPEPPGQRPGYRW
jgi:hypothetical protein